LTQSDATFIVKLTSVISQNKH